MIWIKKRHDVLNVWIFFSSSLLQKEETFLDRKSMRIYFSNLAKISETWKIWAICSVLLLNKASGLLFSSIDYVHASLVILQNWAIYSPHSSFVCIPKMNTFLNKRTVHHLNGLQQTSADWNAIEILYLKENVL